MTGENNLILHSNENEKATASCNTDNFHKLTKQKIQEEKKQTVDFIYISLKNKKLSYIS